MGCIDLVLDDIWDFSIHPANNDGRTRVRYDNGETHVQWDLVPPVSDSGDSGGRDYMIREMFRGGPDGGVRNCSLIHTGERFYPAAKKTLVEHIVKFYRFSAHDKGGRSDELRYELYQALDHPRSPKPF